MPGQRAGRRLAAILVADVAGYSALMEADEAATLAALKRLRSAVFAPEVAAHRGRIVKVMGDGAIVVFGSVVDAVNCAVAIQQRVAALDAETPEGPRIALRIGVNLGDVLTEGGDVYGDGVNVAARLQEASRPGGVALSATAYEHVAGKVPARFRDAGERRLKHLARPVRLWEWPADAPAGAAEAPALPAKPSIAVLPFDNLSGDPGQEWFADGVVEALTATLSRIRSFFVIARNSAFAYKGRARNVREIGRELGVAYVLEGSVQRAGGRVRITVQLIETAGGAHLWAEKYDGALDDIFELQDRIAEQAAGALQPSIRLAEIERARRKRPQELGAYDYTMQAMPLVWALEKERVSEGEALLAQALALDPDYPLALALTAWCWAQRSVYDWVENVAEAKARALTLVERAANASSDDPLVLAILGTAQSFARNLGSARVLLERAVALDPNAAWAHGRLGWLEVYSDRPEAAMVCYDRALRLSPLDPVNFNIHVGRACANEIAGRYDEAAALFLRALGERPSAAWIHRNLAPALHAAGRLREAEASRDALLAAYPNFTLRRYRDAMVFTQPTLDRLCRHLAALGIPEG